MKIMGGSLKVKAVLHGGDGEDAWEEKVNQIRICSGGNFQAVNEAQAGMVCAVTGLNHTKTGEGLGTECGVHLPVLEPVLSYQIRIPEDCDVHQTYRKFLQLEEEEPELHITWNKELGEIYAQLMGEVQTEVLKNMISERFGIAVEFGAGNIVYKETITEPVIGIGHFEPLRHYAEVHLLMEPGEPGSGLQFETACSEDVLDRNWQRLILTHLAEKQHIGVLTGSEITDMKITLIAGRAHQKHTEGGDFRQATYRALRQGNYYVIAAASVLLWAVTVPLWVPFFRDVQGLDNAADIFAIVIRLAPFYIAYAGCAIIDSIFVGLGKTGYTAVNSLLVNLGYYGVFYLLYRARAITFTMDTIILMFGFGMVVHYAISLVQERVFLRRRERQAGE